MLGRGGIGDFHSVSPTKFVAAGSCAENFRRIHTVITLYVLTVKITGDNFRIIAINIFWVSADFTSMRSGKHSTSRGLEGWSLPICFVYFTKVVRNNSSWHFSDKRNRAQQSCILFVVVITRY